VNDDARSGLFFRGDGAVPTLGQKRFSPEKEPFRVELTCYEVLLANNDPRAGPVLAAAYARLQERAARLDATSRPAFLEQVPAHRAIVAAVAGTQ